MVHVRLIGQLPAAQVCVVKSLRTASTCTSMLATPDRSVAFDVWEPSCVSTCRGVFAVIFWFCAAFRGPLSVSDGAERSSFSEAVVSTGAAGVPPEGVAAAAEGPAVPRVIAPGGGGAGPPAAPAAVRAPGAG